MSQLPVVVVGAGPVGCTAALLLAARGLEVLLLERRPAPPPVPRAVHLDDEALRALADAGVADEFLAVSRPVAGLRLLDAGHRVLAEFRRDPRAGRHGWPQASMFHQPDLEAVLRAAVARAPRIALRAPAEVAGLEERADRSVTVALADGGRLDAAAVLGCDGAHSTVRRLTGARMRAFGRPDRWLVVDLRSPSPLPVWPGVHQVCDPARAATFMPVSGDRYRFETRLLDGETVAGLAAPEVLRPLLAPFGADGAEVVRAAEYVYRAQVADRWRRGRVLLAGDAAHLTPPFVGQGLGLGLRDAHQVAWKVAAVVSGAAGEELLATHGAERGPHARALVRLAAVVGRLMTGGGAGAVPVRRAVLAAVARVPALAAYATDSRTPPLRPGPLVDRRGTAGRRLAGTPVPRARVRAGGRECRLDDVLGPGTAVLALAPSGLTVTAGGRRTAVDDVDGALTAWLRGGRARWVVIRPDRLVRAAG